jgi:NAD(P)-dependent dehydrogenase (short-subunit alcohol dehydrogenase family)
MPKASTPSAIVTGAGSGIGLGLATRLLREGWHVTACDVNLDALEEASSLLRLTTDVRNAAALKGAAAATLAATGRIDALVTCAAIYTSCPFLELTEAAWDNTFDINVAGSLRAAQAVLPTMRMQKSGNIVFFSSTLARHGIPKGAAYATSKGAVLGLMRSLALEVAQTGIRVNCVSPGIADTPQPRSHMKEEDLYARAANIPLGRIGRVEDNVEAVLFLLSDDASFVTGQDIRVTGGERLF